MSSPFILSENPDGPVVLRSPLLNISGVVHAFTTRRGGVSGGPFASLNFGLKAGDDPWHVRQNLALLSHAENFNEHHFFRVRQVHGREVVVVRAEDDPRSVSLLEADALITDRPGFALGVSTADCVPVLVADPRHGVVAAAHAGWRGIVGGVVQAVVEIMRQQFDVTPADLRAAIGPCIGPCCFEVGPEVAERFAAFPHVCCEDTGSRPHIDLPRTVRQILEGLGLPGSSIDQANLCTQCRSDLFFSYRRDGARTGHHLSMIGLRPISRHPMAAPTSS
jgi:polyphenol oxidase